MSEAKGNLPKALHENGIRIGEVRKMDGTNTSLDETSEGLATTQTDKKVAM